MGKTQKYKKVEGKTSQVTFVRNYSTLRALVHQGSPATFLLPARTENLSCLSWLRFKLRSGIMHWLQAAELFLHDLYQVTGWKGNLEAKKRFIPGVNIAHGGRLRHGKEGQCRNGSCLLKGSLHIPPVPGMCHSSCVLLHP